MRAKVHSHSGRRLPLAHLTERLRGRALRITGPRKSILEVLRRQAHPLSVREVHAELAGRSCDLATVYRSLDLLEKMGLVKRFDFGDGGARFELLKEGDDGHHHHLVCRGCSVVVEIVECFPSEWEQRIARANGFHQVTHRLEFFGLCPRCQPASPVSPVSPAMRPARQSRQAKGERA